MRVRQLGLKAFGPFSGRVLDFSSGLGRVELIFGPNEAGKSTVLRAVRGLFFGIPENSEDAHQHPPAELVVEGELEDDSLKTLFLRRRKRRKDSLRDAKDAAVDEALLKNFLGGVDRVSFERLFAFDHAGLARAAEAMLTGQGDIGETLFDAGSGLSGVGRLLAELDTSSREIFTPQARTRRLNVLIKEYRALQAELRKDRLLPEAYAAQEERLSAAREQVERLRADRLRLEVELARLVRTERALPWLGKRDSAEEALVNLGEVPRMPADAPERRRSAERARDAAIVEASHLDSETARHRERLDRLGPSPPLAELGEEALVELLSGLNAVSAARLELPERRAALALLDAEVVETRQRLGVSSSKEGAFKLSLRASEVSRARYLVSEHAVLVEARSHLARREAEIRTRFEEMEPPGLGISLEALESALEFSRSLGSGPKLGELKLAIAALETELRHALSKLSPSPRSDVAVHELVLPSEETLERLSNETLRLALERARLEERLGQLDQRVRLLCREIERVGLEGALPTQDELHALRAERQRSFETLEQILASGEPGASVRLLELKAAVLRADQLSDRLLLEATSISELSGYRAELAEKHREMQEQGRLLEINALRRGELDSELTEAFREALLTPLPAPEMRAWLSRQREASRIGLLLLDARRRLSQVLEDQTSAQTRLLAAVGQQSNVPGDLETLLWTAEQLATAERKRRLSVEETQRRKQAAHGEFSLVQAEARVHAEKFEALSQDYQRVVLGFGLDASTSPAELSGLLDSLAALLEKQLKRPELVSGIALLEAKIAAFESEISRLVLGYARDLEPLSAEAAARALIERHREARARARERLGIERGLTDLDERRADADSRLRTAEQALGELARIFGVTQLDALESWELSALEAERLRNVRDEAEAELVRIGEGRRIERLAEEAKSYARDEILPRKRAIQEELERLEQAAYEARHEAESLEIGFARLGGQEAADSAQRLSDLVADIRDASETFARLRLSHAILSRELSRFREKTQGPVLRRASELFARLTLGSYQGLRVGLDERVLECVRSAGRGVRVEELSEGTRYQLYFALRLASLERSLETGPALPLVLDDVFIHWDDERARAGFEVLCELAERTQVLFFTHHAHLGPLATRALGENRVRIHELSSYDANASLSSSTSGSA